MRIIHWISRNVNKQRKANTNHEAQRQRRQRQHSQRSLLNVQTNKARKERGRVIRWEGEERKNCSGGLVKSCQKTGACVIKYAKYVKHRKSCTRVDEMSKSDTDWGLPLSLSLCLSGSELQDLCFNGVGRKKEKRKLVHGKWAKINLPTHRILV